MKPPKTAGKMMRYILRGYHREKNLRKKMGKGLVTPKLLRRYAGNHFKRYSGEAIEQMIVELNALCQ